MGEPKNFGKGSVYVDRDGCVHYDGDPLYGDEFAERALLAFHTTREAEKPLFALRLKNGLSGRAWTLTHKRPELVVNTLAAAAEANPKGAVEVVIAVVRTSCEKVAPLRKKEAFDEYFTKGGRRGGEGVQDYIGRRQNEYDLLTSLSSSTSLSEDLRAYFLLQLSGVDEQQHKHILGQCGNEYDWEKITSTMLIQLDRAPPAAADAGWRGRRWQHAYAADGDHDEHEWDAMASTAAPSSVGPSASCVAGPADDPHGDEDVEALAADMEELEEALESVDLEGLRDDELEQMAMEAQKLGHRFRRYSGKPNYRSARQVLSQGKGNRGWQMQVTDQGSLKVDSKPIQDKVLRMKSKTKCHACGQIGHWLNDPECPRRGSSQGGSARRPRPGGFLNRAGLALAMIRVVAGHMLPLNITQDVAYTENVTVMSPIFAHVLKSEEDDQGPHLEAYGGVHGRDRAQGLTRHGADHEGEAHLHDRGPREGPGGLRDGHLGAGCG